MFKVILALLLMTAPALGAEQWTVGNPLATDNPVNFPVNQLANNDSLDRLLANFRQGMTLTYVNASSASVSAGSIVCNNAGVHTFRQNTSSTTITTANLDAGGSFTASSTFYVYANCSANATTATFTISLNGTTPAGVTAYREIGTFATDGSSNILQASLNQEVNGYVTADASGNKEIQGVFNYGTSFSSSTYVTGNVKIAYGQATGISGNSSSAITNLPFTSSSSYSCSCSQSNSQAFNESPSIVINSGSQATVYNNHNDNVGGNGNCNWICIGT